MSMDNQGESLHFFSAYAVLDRIDFSTLSNEYSIGQPCKLPLSTFLPNVADCNAFRENYAILLGREIMKSIPYFSFFEEFIPQHILHKYSDKMSQKSNIVSIELVLLNTTKFNLRFLLELFQKMRMLLKKWCLF